MPPTLDVSLRVFQLISCKKLTLKLLQNKYQALHIKYNTPPHAPIHAPIYAPHIQFYTTIRINTETHAQYKYTHTALHTHTQPDTCAFTFLQPNVHIYILTKKTASTPFHTHAYTNTLTTQTHTYSPPKHTYLLTYAHKRTPTCYISHTYIHIHKEHLYAR